jgi:hypothetical protein
VNPAGKIPGLGEAGLMQKLHSLGTPRSHLAEGYNLAAGIEFAHPIRKLGEWDKVAANIRLFVLVLTAHVEQKEILTGIKPLFQFFNLDFRNAHCFSPHYESTS